MLLLAISLLAAQDPAPLLLHDRELLEATRTSLTREDSPLRAAAERLRRDAEKALTAGPFSVTNKTQLAPSGDPHDYRSFGPYWWPDPEREDGLPYIRRDGEGNPETRDGSASDSRRRKQMVSTVETLALSYHLFGEEEHANRAAELMRVWFLDEQTLMNPHLEYGQAIPGRVEGRDIGIIDTRKLWRVADAAVLLLPSEGWSAEDHAGLTAWFEAYLDWLLESSHGRREAKKRNNHGTYYDVQVVSIALFVGREELAREQLGDVSRARMLAQLEPSGAQPEELARTKSFGYSSMNLLGFFHLARLGERAGVDLWSDLDEDGRGLRTAFTYLAADREWPHPQLGGVKRVKLLPLVLEAEHAELDPRAAVWAEELLEADDDHRARLLLAR